MKEEAKQKIAKLVEKYEAVERAGRIRSYTEEETKKDFILPLFEALGWGVYEKKEVSAEESQSGGRVDYGFYLDSRIKFYLEAKPLKSDIHEEEYAKQAIRYSWNKGVTWAVLTNFETIKLFNAGGLSQYLGDKLIFGISCADYLKDFDRLWLLSKEAFEKSLLDTEAEKIGKKLQKVSVGDSLYKDLQLCRKILTDDLAKCNDELKKDKDLLDEGVQKILDRLIFIRVAEDRGVEQKTLIPLVREWESTKGGTPLYTSMISKFRELDDIYDSNLFSPHPFEKWEEFGGATEKVIDILYGKKGYYEYDFKVMPADVLGHVYESYLGYRLSQSRKGLTLDKDATKRKEQGIYYTPTFIVDYIVRNALKPVLDACTSIHDLKEIKVLDPACGSGSFLLKALEVINEKYKEFGDSGKEETKLGILLENIYGVDLDEQAVEITRLNLLISALDSRVKLPPLKNIKNGNSLISGTDEELYKQFGKNWRDKKPFNWREEFPEVFKQGGFDVIIGNPPYIKEFVNKDAFDGLHSNPYYQGKMDIWTMFACICIDLLKDTGLMSFIAPNNWISNAGASIFRDKVLKDGELRTFIDFGDYKIFEQAGIQTMVFVFEKKEPNKQYSVEYFKVADKNLAEDKLTANMLNRTRKVEIEPGKLIGKNIAFSSSEFNSILYKLENKKNFELDEQEVGQGIVAAPDKYFIVKEVGSYNKNERDFLKPFYTASGRYKSGKSENYIFYICDKNFGNKKLGDYPNIERHFERFEKNLKEAKKKYGTPDKAYFYLHRERNEDFFSRGPKIVCGIRVSSPSFFYTEEPYYGSRALNLIKTNRINLKYLTGILNSKVSFFWLKNKGKQLGDLMQVDKGPLLAIPIYRGDEKQQREVATLVDNMLSLNKELHEKSQDSEKWRRIKTEIERTDQKIDDEIYKIYELTEDEIRVVEQGT